MAQEIVRHAGVQIWPRSKKGHCEELRGDFSAPSGFKAIFGPSVQRPLRVVHFSSYNEGDLFIGPLLRCKGSQASMTALKMRVNWSRCAEVRCGVGANESITPSRDVWWR